MRLSVLGAGPAYTDVYDAAGAAYLVTHGDTSLLLDLGHGSFSRIFRDQRPEDLDAVVISHLHPDHFVDLVPMRHYLRYEFQPPRRMRVLGPSGLDARLDALHAEPGFSAQALDTEVLGETTRTIGELTLESRKVWHTDESYAFRVAIAGSDAPGLVYSGDCGSPDDLAPLIHPGDALLIEVAFGVGPGPAGVPHLTGEQVGRLAAATQPGRVLLTHILLARDPEGTLAAVTALYDGSVSFVWPGTRLDL
jgi:ribonuclease BN (tRNA processing enzyme)